MHSEVSHTVWLASPQLKVDSSINAILASPKYSSRLKPVTVDTIPSNSEIEEEFNLLNYLTFTQSHEARLVTHNQLQGLNRYSDVLAYKDSIIKLDDAENLHPSNYIHANIVKNPTDSNQPLNFIATQGPLEHTCGAFWKMIELNKPPLIVAIVEKKSLGLKCHDYWPITNVEKSCGDYLISEQKRIQSEFVDLTHLSIENLKSKEAQQTNHIHLHSWIDKSVYGEKDYDKYVDILKLIHSKHKESPNLPVVIHCSAGIGRTGTLISSYFLYEQWLRAKEQQRPFTFSIFGVVRHVREQRFAAVETAQQYAFLYKIVKFFAK